MRARWIVVVFVSSACVAALARAETPVAVTTRVEPYSVTIGTPFRLTMTIEAEPGVEVSVPVLSDRIGDFLIQDFGGENPRRDAKGKSIVERWYTLITYETGAQFIPAAEVPFRRAGGEVETATAPKTLVDVRSLLSSEPEAADVRDIKGPVAVPASLTPLWIGMAALALAIAAASVIYWLAGRRHGPSAERRRPPHEIALVSLRELRAERLIEAGRHERYYVRLSDIVRRYLEARFVLRAPEMTTEEFLAAAQRSTQLRADQRAALQQFLGEADLVKFARHVPTAEQAERAWDAARDFVEATREREEVARAAA